MPLVNIPLKLPGGDRAIRFELDPARANERNILGFLENGKMYEQEVALVAMRAIQSGDTVLDIGADVGMFTALAAVLAGPEGYVIGFEPAPENRTRLAANLALNDLTHVVVVDRPASDRVGDAMFHLNRDNSGGHSLWDPGLLPANRLSRENPRPAITRTTTVDVEMSQAGLTPPRLIRINTGGAEHRVLTGAAELLREFEVPYIIAELNEFGLYQMRSSQNGLRGFMAELGYNTFLLYEDGSLPKLVPRGTKIESRYFLNLLFSTQEHVAALWPSETFSPYTHA